MDKAEQRAFEAYPEQDMFRTANHYQAERRKEKRRIYRMAYRDGEKDTINEILEWLKSAQEQKMTLDDAIAHFKAIKN